MVRIRGVPLLSIWLELCKRTGIEEVLTHVPAHAAAVCNFLKDNTNGVQVRVIAEPQLLGSAGTLRANRDWVDSDEFFWIFYADVLNRADFSTMMQIHRRRNPAATLGLYEGADPRRCGIVTMGADGVIQEFGENPDQPVGNLAFSGLMIGTPAMLDAIPEETPVDIGFHVLPRLAGRMVGYRIDEYLIDIGTMAKYENAQRTWPGFLEV